MHRPPRDVNLKELKGWCPAADMKESPSAPRAEGDSLFNGQLQPHISSEEPARGFSPSVAFFSGTGSTAGASTSG